MENSNFDKKRSLKQNKKENDREVTELKISELYEISSDENVSV